MNSELGHVHVTSDACDSTNSQPQHEVENIVALARLELYNRGAACGPKAVRERLDEAYAVQPLPSTRTIARILTRKGLSNGRTGFYDDESGRPTPKAGR